MEEQNAGTVQEGYDKVASQYALRIFDELSGKPLDRALLDRLAQEVQGHGPICDLGCGPGHVARYLQQQGADVFGIDLSPKMVLQARQLNPGITFAQGSMLALDVQDESWGGIPAFYSIIHFSRSELRQAFREMCRVLRPNGLALLAFHVGHEVVHLDEWWGEAVSLDFFFLQPDLVQMELTEAGFVIEDVIQREPYLGVEHPSRRAYIFARKQDNA